MPKAPMQPPAKARPDAPDVKALLAANSTNLSWVAETADGTRRKSLLLVIDANEQLHVREKTEPGDWPLAEIRTEALDRREVVEVTCRVKDCEEPKPLPPVPEEGWTWDALFWTQSAVEKFLYPYYHSQRLWDKKMERLKAKFDKDKNAVAVAHRAPSNSSILPAQGLSIGRLMKDARNQLILTWTPFDQYLKPKEEEEEITD